MAKEILPFFAEVPEAELADLRRRLEPKFGRPDHGE